MRFQRPVVGAICALCFILCICSPVLAASGDEQFKTDIEGFLNKLNVATHGVLNWEGADSFQIRQEGDAAVAVISNARLSIHQAKTSQLVLDHVEIRRKPAEGNAEAAKFEIVFPTQSTLTLEDGTKTSLALKNATASLVLEQAANRFRETLVSFSGARLEHPATGDWVNFGPLSFSSKLVSAADGGWSSPVDFELKQVEFSLSEGPVSGAINRIAYNALSSGPDVAALNRFRDRMDELRQQGDQPPGARADALLDLLPSMPSLFSLAKGEAIIEGLAVRGANGEPLASLAKASFGGAVTGLSGDAAAWRITLRQNGLTLATSVLDPKKVPENATIDFELENVATGPLRTILEAVSKLRKGAAGPDAQQATARMIGAAAMLNPVFRIYELTVKTKDVGIAGAAEATGSPITPKGYTAEADVVVHGFDALPALLGDAPFAEYLPLLKVLGTGAAGSDTKFHLTSSPQKRLAVNGNDISSWFGGGNAEGGQPRLLRPTRPPLQGDDVRAVQRALNAAKIDAPQNGTYDGATAVAVAQFQKQSGLNIDGVVDAATRDKLGVKPVSEPAPQPDIVKPPGR